MWNWLENAALFMLPYFEFPAVIGHIVDITVVAYVLYHLLLLIKETRAEQVLKGLVVLLFVTWMSDILKLNTIHWILQTTGTVGVIALLIVFQPELRRALEQIGRGKIFEKAMFLQQDERESSAIVDEIVSAVENLAASKTGALIVVERTTGLNDVVMTGTRIEGQLSSQLLENIFVPNTPLHDGAVIIRGDRIVAAACWLPLTENPNLSKQLGTRHRAALGISENSDSLTIIISEETGVISLANNGKLTRYLDTRGLQDILRSVYGKEKETKPFNLIRRRARND